MSAPWPWTERRFTFDYPVEKHPDVLGRFRGLPARVEDLVRPLPPAALTARLDSGWTIQENIGHLLDLEPLLDGRIDDFLRGRPTLRAADMSNRATHEAGHNERPIEDLLGGLRRERDRLVLRLETLAGADWARTAVHPRLKMSMRLVDAVTFACEHDDYHVARMFALARLARA